MLKSHRGPWLKASITLCALAEIHNAGIAAGSVLNIVTPNMDGQGYGHFAWQTMTADLIAANGDTPLATTTDLSNLPQLMSYTGLWLDARQPVSGSLTATETANLQAYIASGRRVVLIGGPGPQPGYLNYSSWNDAIMGAVGGPTGTSYFASSSTPAQFTSPVITSAISAIVVPGGATAPSGLSLFSDRVATVWGPAHNAIVFLDQQTLSDDYLTSDFRPTLSDAPFASNLAMWVAGGLTDGPSIWKNNAGGGWQDPSPWQLSQRPSIADDTVFNLGSAGYTVTVPGSFTARNLMVQNDRVTIDLSNASSALTLGQAILVGQPASTSGSLTLTRSVGGSAASITASGVSVGGSGSGTLTVTSGVQLVVSGPTTVAAGSSLIVSGGTLSTAKVSGNGMVSIVDGSIAIANAPKPGALNTVATLKITGAGQLDLANSDLDVRTSDLTTMTGEIGAGYAGGTWTGNGIASTAAATDPTRLTALGVILNNDGSGHPLYGAGAALGLFDGVSPGLNDLLVKYTYYGDANLDGHVDGSDYTLIDNGFHHNLTEWSNGDFNYDGVIDGSDYTLIDNAFNLQGNALATAGTEIVAQVTSQIAEMTSVPEPCGTAIVMIAVMSLRRRKLT